MQLQTIKKFMVGLLVLYVSVLLSGCCGNNSNSQSNTNYEVKMDTNAGGVANHANDVSLTPIIVLAFSVPMNPSTINSSSIILTTNPNGVESSITISNITSNESNTIFSFNPAESLLANTKYYVVVNSNSKTTNAIVITGQFDFTTGTRIFPMVSIINPNNQATNVTKTPSMQIKFSSAVINVNLTSVTLHKGSEDGVEIELSWITAGADNNYFFSPLSQLDSQATYYIVLSSNIISTTGNNLNPTSFSFTTGNLTIPNVSLINPSNGGVDFPTNPNIQIQFSESVININSTTISLLESSINGRSIALKPIISGPNNIYTINPTLSLAENTIYYIVLESGITNSSGNPLPKTTFYFTTSKESTFILVGEGGLIDKLLPSGQLVNVNAPHTEINGATYANNKFVAAGSSGVILNSRDGATWNLESSGAIEHLLDVTYANGLFVMVGNNGTILTSNNGTSWTIESNDINVYLSGIVYSNNKFVAVGDQGAIITSSNGSSWTIESDQATNANLLRVTYANGKFIAVGESGTIITSANSANWSLESSGTNVTLRGVTANQNLIVSVGLSATILTSTNGTSWTTESSPATHNLLSVTNGNSLFIAVGQVGTILKSNDGTNWTLESSNTSDDFFNVTYGNGMFIAFGKEGAIVSSPDGINWTVNQTQGTLLGVTCSNNKFATVGTSGTIMNSADGNIWSIESTNPNVIYTDITYASKQFIAVGGIFNNSPFKTNISLIGSIYTSSNGLDWSLESTIDNILFSSIAYGVNIFVTVGGIPFGQNNHDNFPQIARSVDAITWNIESSGADNFNISGITYGNGLFTAIGTKENISQNSQLATTTIITSPDGVNWSAKYIETSNNFSRITYGNGIFVAVGNSGSILMSSNAVDWANESSGTTQDLNGITYGGGQFLATGSSGTVLTSYDGINWNILPIANGLYLTNACAY